jgi:hypothetical protein
LGEHQRRRSEVARAAARDGWGVTLRYFLLEPGPSLIKWLLGAGGSVTVLHVLAMWLLPHL